MLEPLSDWNALRTDVDEQQHVGVTLTITSGLHRGASMALQSGEYLVGSGEDCDIVLRDTSGKRTRAIRHICWDGYMFPNSVMRHPQTWNDVLKATVDVRDAHGWRQ